MTKWPLAFAVCYKPLQKFQITSQIARGTEQSYSFCCKNFRHGMYKEKKRISLTVHFHQAGMRNTFQNIFQGKAPESDHAISESSSNMFSLCWLAFGTNLYYVHIKAIANSLYNIPGKVRELLSHWLLWSSASTGCGQRNVRAVQRETPYLATVFYRWAPLHQYDEHWPPGGSSEEVSEWSVEGA